jgi:hypothetical protein
MAGNANSGRQRHEKPFADALRMEILASGEDHKALRAVARALIAKAREGDMQAINTLADRMDGKVPQAHIGGEEDDPAIMIGIIERRIVKAPARD